MPSAHATHVVFTKRASKFRTLEVKPDHFRFSQFQKTHVVKIAKTEFPFGVTKKEKSSSGQTSSIAIEYYQRPFFYLSEKLIKSGYAFKSPPEIRKSFWSLVHHRRIEPHSAPGFLFSYAKVVGQEMRAILSSKSIGYWLHLFRRIGPGPVGTETAGATIMTTRSILEAAAQKYAALTKCSHIARVKDVGIRAILSGMLMESEFSFERRVLEESDQIALTDFTPDNLREFYDLERLAHEIWRCGALLRITGKGAPLVILPDFPFVADDRGDELDDLVENFDNRSPGPLSSSKGVTMPADSDAASQSFFVPIWNANQQDSGFLEPFYEEMFKLRLTTRIVPNFIWAPIQLKEYVERHRPYANAFAARHGVSYDSFFSVLAAFLSRIPYYWVKTNGEAMLRGQQRAYDGLFTTAQLESEAEYFLPRGMEILGLRTPPSKKEIVSAIRLLTLTAEFQSRISFLHPRAHAAIIPYDNVRWFLDYAWTANSLFYLFEDLKIQDERFKGALLEKHFQTKPSFLPTKECRGNDGTSKQIDFSISIRPFLVILECKAMTRTIGVEHGSARALSIRREKVVEASLTEVDDKAQWLASHPVGANYDISEHTDIVPVGISAFREFIHSKAFRYWLTDKIPRVLTPDEFEEFLGKTNLKTVLNRVAVRWPAKPHA